MNDIDIANYPAMLEQMIRETRAIRFISNQLTPEQAEEILCATRKLKQALEDLDKKYTDRSQDTV